MIKVDRIDKLPLSPMAHTGQSVFRTNWHRMSSLCCKLHSLWLYLISTNNIFLSSKKDGGESDKKKHKKLPKEKLSSSGCAWIAALSCGREPSSGMPPSHQSSTLRFESGLPRRGIKGPTHLQRAQSHSSPKHHLLQESKPSLLVLLLQLYCQPSLINALNTSTVWWYCTVRKTGFQQHFR